MYNYQVDEEINKTVEGLLKEQKNEQPKIPSSETELNDILKQIEKDNSWAQGEVGDYVKNELNLERLETSEFDEEGARKKVENFYGEEQLIGKQNIEDNAIKEKEALENKKQSLIEKEQASKVELAAAFEERKEDAKKDAINRGLARSSIIINKIEAFDEKMLSEYNKINIEYSKAFDNIEHSLNMLEVQKENALKNFDLSYAIKINQKIDELKAEHAKKQDEVLKYNNEIAQKEAEFAAKEQERSQAYDSNIIKNNTAYWAAVDKFGKDVVDKQMQDSKYVYVEAYFKSLPPKEAHRILVSSGYWLDQVGVQNFVKLANELSKAASGK